MVLHQHGKMAANDEEIFAYQQAGLSNAESKDVRTFEQIKSRVEFEKNFEKVSKFLRFQQSVFLLPQKIQETHIGENFFGYTKLSNMICDFEELKTLPMKPCFEYSRILNSSEAIKFIE